MEIVSPYTTVSETSSPKEEQVPIVPWGESLMRALPLYQETQEESLHVGYLEPIPTEEAGKMGNTN